MLSASIKQKKLVHKKKIQNVHNMHFTKSRCKDTTIQKSNKTRRINHGNYVGIEPLKARHDVTKLDSTIPLLFFWCIDIYLSIQSMSLTFYMTWVYQELYRRYKSLVPYKQISCPRLVHRFRQSSRDYSKPPPNQRDDLSWLLGWISYGECTSVCDAHQTGPTVNHDARLSIIMINQVTILHELSTLRGY